MGQHELGSRPAAAERLALPLRAPVRIVTAERAVACQERADLTDEVVDGGLGPRNGVSQDMSPPGPAMNPSSDIVTEYCSLPMSHLRRVVPPRHDR